MKYKIYRYLIIPCYNILSKLYQNVLLQINQLLIYYIPEKINAVRPIVLCTKLNR